MKPLKTALFLFLCGFVLFSCQQPSNTNEEASQATISNATTPTPPKEEKLCFLKALNKDTTTVTLTIIGEDITGEMIWQPWEKDGAVGTLAGKKKANGEMELLYSYTIEGSEQTETKIMKIENGKLAIKEGELVDPNNDGNLKYKDPSSAIYSEIIEPVSCH